MIILATKESKIRNTLVFVLVLNLLVAFMKAILGFLTNAISMVADGIHSTLDASSNIIGLISIRYAFDPPDKEHQFGHRKYEVIAAFMISVFLLFTCYEILQAVIERLIFPVLPEIGILNYAVMFFTILINLFVYRYEQNMGLKLQSPILTSDSAHTKSDLFVSISVVIGLFFSSIGVVYADPLAAAMVILLIGKEAIVIFRENLDILADSAKIDSEILCKIAMEIPGVLDAHNIRTRGIVDEVFVDLHIVVDPQITVFDGHEIATQVQRLIRTRMDQVKEVYVHVEPDGLS